MTSENTYRAEICRERIVSDAEGVRLDVFLSKKLGISRSFAGRMIRERLVLPENRALPQKLKPSTRLAKGETLLVEIPPVETLEIEPQNVPFNVVYEDEYLLIVDKPAGLVVHPAPGNWSGTLVHGLLWRYPDLGPFNNVRRPGIVHRLDAGTSGLMVVAREQRTMELLQESFRDRTIDKRYLALVHGGVEPSSGILEGPIARHPQNRVKMAVVEGGRPSTTEYRALWKTRRHSFVSCKLVTGRTHQIRVHLRHKGFPILCDKLYGHRSKITLEELSGTKPIAIHSEPSAGTVLLERQALHAHRLTFEHPETGRTVEITAPIPADIRSVVEALKQFRKDA